MQGDLFGKEVAKDSRAAGRPDGLVYRPDFLTSEEERALLEQLRTLSFRPFEFQNFLGKRQTISFGWSYRFDGSGLVPADPFPDWLIPVRDRAASLAGLPPESIEHALLIEYGIGAGLGWHRDRPVFGEVIGISLLHPAPLRFRRRRGGGGKGWDRFTLNVEPRSAYLLRGDARHVWEHSIPPVADLRYSITLRTMRPAKAGARAPEPAQL